MRRKSLLSEIGKTDFLFLNNYSPIIFNQNFFYSGKVSGATMHLSRCKNYGGKMKFHIFKKNILSFSWILLQAVLISAITVFSVLPFSCKVSTEGIELASGDYDSPTLKELKVIDEKTLEIEFSEWVRIRSVVVSPYIEGVSDSYERSISKDLARAIAGASGQNGAIRCSIETSDDGRKVTFLMEDSTVVGKKYEILGIVEDSHGNSLTFCVPFNGFNPCIPNVLITEIQPKYKGTENKVPVYKCEYAELLVLEDGNLAGLEIFFASYESKCRFIFPAVDVKKGEVIIVHLRTAGDGCISETGDDFTESTRTFSNSNVRDIWSENKSKCLNSDNDILIVRNIVNQKIVDGVMFSNKKIDEWEGNELSFAQLLVDEGFYDSIDIDNSAESNVGTSLKKSIHRKNAKVLREKLLEGELNIEEFKLQKSSNWICTELSPGDL